MYVDAITYEYTYVFIHAYTYAYIYIDTYTYTCYLPKLPGDLKINGVTEKEKRD